ncbi:MAG: hypothetical protein LQ348_000220 [Seirophora lacunosa]|nr:MAG: hypothetical protein LQ348_000220 [Seirophora lacunosa]
MPSTVTAYQLGEAILDAVQHSSYPESEDIISADFPPSAFPQALDLLNTAREEVKARVRKSSKQSAPDIDGWILQAKQLRSDIETAHRSAEEIVIKAKRNEELLQTLHDSGSKLRLLEEEVAFNQNLTTVLEQIQQIRRDIGEAHDLVNEADLSTAAKLLLKVDVDLESIQRGRNIKGVAIVQLESRELRQTVAQALTRRWHDAIQIDAQFFTFSIPFGVSSFSPIATAMQQIGLLEGVISNLVNQIEYAIITPRLQQRADICERRLLEEKNAIRLSQPSSPSDLGRLLHDLGVFLRFIQTRLPSSISDPLSKICGPSLVESLISTRLSAAVPQEVAALQHFNSTLEEVNRFSQTMDDHGWPGANQLRAWTNSIPQIWLEKRQRQSLGQVRKLLQRGLGDIKSVERVETQTVSQQDGLFHGNQGNDDWNAEWSEGEESSFGVKQVESQNTSADTEVEDVRAWGLDDGKEENKTVDNSSVGGKDDEADAWGWGDDNDNDEGSQSPQRTSDKPFRQGINGHAQARRGSEREVTLRESYNITSLPLEILDLINNIIADAYVLGTQSSGDSPLGSALPGLSNLPSLLLIMYRASASNFYSIKNSGNMFLYNDCLWLADQLRQVMQPPVQGPENRFTSSKRLIRFDDDMAALEAFGKRSYGKEMESQRTILKDLLDGAQGFANCTESPFSQECDLAVASITDRLRDIHKQWKGALSHSALLQSVGSLLGTIIDKIVIDIEDMSDISEPESQRLTAYCKQIIALEDLFLPQESATGEAETVPLTAVYAHGWFKFQYLSEVLDSSLVDIKYLWMEGGLGLEYEVEEVVDLIEALFADSEHRRRAIGEIRRSPGK